MSFEDKFAQRLTSIMDKVGIPAVFYPVGGGMPTELMIVWAEHQVSDGNWQTGTCLEQNIAEVGVADLPSPTKGSSMIIQSITYLTEKAELSPDKSTYRIPLRKQ